MPVLLVGNRMEKIKSIKGVSDMIMEEVSEFNLDDYNSVDKLLYQTGLSPDGFINTNGSNSRITGFTEEGIELKALSSNGGNARNSGLELVENISYINSHRSMSGSGD